MKTVAALLIVIAPAGMALGQTSTITYDESRADGVVSPARLAPNGAGGVYVTDPPAKQIVEYEATPIAVLCNDDSANPGDPCSVNADCTGGGSDPDGLCLEVPTTYSIPEGPIGIATHTDGRIALSLENGTVAIYDVGFVDPVLVDPAPLTLSRPNGLAFDAGKLYVVDSTANRVLVFEELVDDEWTLATTPVGAFGSYGSDLGQFASPQAIAIDATLGHIIVTDVDNFRAQVFDMAGDVLFKFGYRILYTGNSELAWLARAEGVALDFCGNIYLTDALMGTIRVFDSSGNELDPDNLAAELGLEVPIDIAIDQGTEATGKLFVAGSYSASVEVYDIDCAVAPVPASVAAVDDAGSVRGPKGKHTTKGRERANQVRFMAQPVFPDSPFEIVAALDSGEYCRDLDLDRDRDIDLDDLEIAVSVFGVGTIEDFLSLDGAVASHDAINPPHILDSPNRCGRCHSMDGLPGGMMTASGQENLCLSCHSPGSVALGTPIGGLDTDNSHPWDVGAADGPSEGPDGDSSLADHLADGDIRCGTCHDPHETNEGQPYLRVNNINPALCMECHQTIGDEWSKAGHGDSHADAFSHYDWAEPGRAACRRCHSGDGYIDFADGVAEDDQRGDFRVVDCRTCHAAHGAPQSEQLLRSWGEVVTPWDDAVSLDAGADGTCFACHNGRREPGGYSAAPHYLLGGVMMMGINGAEYGNTSLANSRHSEDTSCAQCHMAGGDGNVGGHTWKMGAHVCNGDSVVPGAACSADADCLDGTYPAGLCVEVENVENACASCHDGLDTYNRTARGDFDGDGATGGVQDEVAGLMQLVYDEIIAAGALDLGRYPYWDTDAVLDVPPGRKQEVKDAIWNYEYVDNDASLGVHNTAYAVGLLQLTYEKLTGSPLAAYLRYVPAGGVAAVDYVGTDACLSCHGAAAVTGTDYTPFLRSGHPYKLNKIQDALAPTYPFSSILGALGLIDDEDGVTDNTLGTPANYGDISYVIGGYGWKSRWIDLAGYIVTGAEVQYNLETMGMVSYHDNEVDKPYNCGNCHTTGWKRYTSEPLDTRNLNRQDGLPGMEGTFAAPGVQCEACHGGGSFHADAPTAANITALAVPRETADFLADDMAYGKAVACGECHTRDGEMDYPTYVAGPGRIAASSGLIKHHEQYDEMMGINPDDLPGGATGPHSALSAGCRACHDPHTTTKYMDISGDDPGMFTECDGCHNPVGVGAKDYSLSGGMAGVACIDCHMPRLAKSAVAHTPVLPETGPVTGDIRSHIFRIDLTTTAQFTPAGDFAYPWVTGDWACNTCHNTVDRFSIGMPDLSTVIHDGTH